MFQASVITFDYVFVGLGAANSLLLLALHEKKLLNDRTFAIIEPDNKTANDRTFCFWANEEELRELQLTSLVSFSWQKVQVSGSGASDIYPLRYYHVNGIDLYDKVRNVLQEYTYEIFKEHLNSIDKIKGKTVIKVNNLQISSDLIFDSRPAQYSKAELNEEHLYQSFFGWKIKLKEGEFDKECIQMMDFDVPQNGYTQFAYVLPYTSKSALVELTRFGAEKIEESEGRVILSTYLENKSLNYIIEEEERGVIPMSSAQIITDSNVDLVPMGSRAGAIKPSSGYAFKKMSLHAQEIVRNLESNFPIKPIKTIARYKFYDRLLLKILALTPQLGKPIFELLFKRVSTKKILQFLDERNNIIEDIVLLSKLPVRPFLKAAFKEFKYQIQKFILINPAIIAAITLIVLNYINYTYLTWTILGAGFLLVGLPHGALDNYIENSQPNKTVTYKFVITYILTGLSMGLIWWLQADIALIIFIAFSASHFGEADFYEWQFQNRIKSFVWGLFCLFSILIFHLEETLSILRLLKTNYLISIIESTHNYFMWMIIALMAVFSFENNSPRINGNLIRSILFLICISFLPLIEGFGVFFIFHHSLHGWKHLKIGMKSSTSELWLRAAPFTLLAIVFFVLFLLFFQNIEDKHWPLFFIFLSIISFPHAIAMHSYYLRLKLK